MNKIQIVLEKHLADVIAFFSENPLNYDALEKRHLKNMVKRDGFKKAGVKQVSATIYDICEKADVGVPIARRVLVYFNNVCHELGKNVPVEKKKLLVSTFVNFLSELDFNYMNFLGELSVLNQILKSNIYSLSDVEFPLGNGFFADFRFLHLEDKKYSLVEVVSIHIPKDKNINEANFKLFFEGKLQDKLANKGYAREYPFTLIPVIWADGWQLEEIYQLYKNGLSIEVSDTIIPSAYLNYYTDSGDAFPCFGRVDTLFDKAIKSTIEMRRSI